MDNNPDPRRFLAIDMARAVERAAPVPSLPTGPFVVGMRLPYMSKHRQFDRDGNHIPGRVRIGEHSGLRKLMRAARRGRVPQERIGVIVRAMQSAAKREREYMHGAARRRAQIADLMRPGVFDAPVS